MSNGTGKPEPTPFRALYNYKPRNDDEVELHEGDIVYVMEKCDDGWFVGTSQRTGAAAVLKKCHSSCVQESLELSPGTM